MPDRAAGVEAPLEVEMIPTPGGTDALLASVGADVDVCALEREIRAEVARKRREGVYSAELLVAVAADPVADLMFALGDAAQFSVDAPVGSGIRRWGGPVSLIKRVTARFLRWYTKWILGQVHTFAAGAVTTLNAVEERLQDHERRLDALTRGDMGVRNEIDSGPSCRLAAHIEALHSVRGRVAVLQSGRGDLLSSLARGGMDCYGVEPSPELAAASRARGLNVIQQEPRAHLAGALPGSLGGLVAGLGDGHLNMNLEELVTMAAIGLAPD